MKQVHPDEKELEDKVDLIREGVMGFKEIFEPWNPGASWWGNWEDGQVPAKDNFAIRTSELEHGFDT